MCSRARARTVATSFMNRIGFAPFKARGGCLLCDVSPACVPPKLFPWQRLPCSRSGYKTRVMLQRVCRAQSRIVVAFALALTSLWGCSQPQEASSILRSHMAPFAQSRSQAISVVGIAKKNLDPDSINQVNVKYAALQVDANDYLGLVVESLEVAGFNQAKNQSSSAELSKTIEGFNGSVEPIMNPLKTRPGISSIPLPLQSQWVTDLSAWLNSGWQTYHAQLSAMAPQDRMMLAQKLKAEYAWPNFQDIATEKLPKPLASPTARTH
jgi:hypothetical protein